MNWRSSHPSKPSHETHLTTTTDTRAFVWFLDSALEDSSGPPHFPASCYYPLNEMASWHTCLPYIPLHIKPSIPRHLYAWCFSGTPVCLAFCRHHRPTPVRIFHPTLRLLTPFCTSVCLSVCLLVCPAVVHTQLSVLSTPASQSSASVAMLFTSLYGSSHMCRHFSHICLCPQTCVGRDFSHISRRLNTPLTIFHTPYRSR